MNHLAWLRTYQAAASDRSGSSELLTYGDLDSTSTHLRYGDETQGRGAAPIGIRTVRLDDLVTSGELRLPRFAKIDVEGHGHRAIEGMRASVAESRPTLITVSYTHLDVYKRQAHPWARSFPAIPSSGAARSSG